MRNFETDVYVSDGGGGGTGTYFFKEKNKKSSSETKKNANNLLPVLKLGFNYKGENEINLHRQIGISFSRRNTFAYDNGYDSEVNDIGSTDFYWHFPDYSNKKLIIAGVPEISEKLQVPLTVVLEKNDAFNIEIDHMRNIESDIFIHDKITNVFYKLSEENPIEFNLEKGKYTNRFFLTFNKENSTLNLDNNFIEKDLKVYLNNDSKEIIIQNKNNLTIHKVEVYTILGQKIKSWSKIKNAVKNKLSVQKLSSSFYIVKVITEKGNISKKIFIKQ